MSRARTDRVIDVDSATTSAPAGVDGGLIGRRRWTTDVVADRRGALALVDAVT